MELRLAGARDGRTLSRQGVRVSTIYVRALIEGVNAAGLTTDEFVRASGVPAAQLANAYSWLDVADFDRLTCCAVELTGDPAFGLRWGGQSPLVKFDVFALVAAHAPTLRECLACLLRFQPILVERPEFEVVERPTSVSLRFHALATTELALRTRAEMGVSALVRLMRHVGATRAEDVHRIAFAHQAPSYTQEYARMFGGHVRFGQTFSGIEIDRAWLDRHLCNGNVELHRVLTLQAQQVLGRVKSSTGYGGELRDYIRRMLPRLPHLRDAARAMALSERSLRRRLAEEGLSYSGIRQEHQLLLARQLLADPTRSVQQVAAEAGFTSTTAFHRAFKRWTGESPAAFRSKAQRRDTE